MSTSAQYAATPKFSSALLTTADTSYTAPTNGQTVLTAGSSGTRIDYIEVVGVATTIAGMCNIFIYNGTNYILWAQVPVIPVTSSTTSSTFIANLSSNSNSNIMPLVIPTGYSIYATTTVTQTGLRVNVYGGDF